MIRLANVCGVAWLGFVFAVLRQGLWLGKNGKGKFGFIRTEDFMISPTDVHKMMHGAFSPSVSPVKIAAGTFFLLHRLCAVYIATASAGRVY